MPTTPLILVLGLLVATCVIAYWADNLGKKLGKKRISLYGLRPRQTATLISMVSSVGIMLFTLLVLFIFSDSVRNALLHYDTVRANLNRAEELNLALQNQNEATLRDMKALEDERAKLSRQVTAADAELERANEQVEETRGRITKAQGQLENIRQRLAATEKSRDAARQAESRAQASASQARRSESAARQAESAARMAESEAGERFDIAQTRYTATQERLRETDERLRETGERLNEVSQRIYEQQEQLEQTQLALDERGEELVGAEKNLEAVQKDFVTTQQQLANANAQLSKLWIDISQLKIQQAKLRSDAHQLLAHAQRILTDPIVLEARTILAANTLPSRISVAQTRAALHQLAREARSSLQNASPPRQLEILAEIEGANIYFTEQELIEQLADYLVQIPIPTSVRIIAARDHIEADDTIIGRFEAVPVRVIYPRGSTLASAIVDGNQGDELIFRGLMRLTDIGAAEARRRGAVPLVTRQEEPFFAEGTNERIFTTLRRISEMNEPVLVRLVADEDLTTVAPLRVRFDLADAPANSGEDSNSDAESS